MYGLTSNGVGPICAKDGTIYKEKKPIKERRVEHFSEQPNLQTNINENITDNLPQWDKIPCGWPP